MKLFKKKEYIEDLISPCHLSDFELANYIKRNKEAAYRLSKLSRKPNNTRFKVGDVILFQKRLETHKSRIIDIRDKEIYVMGLGDNFPIFDDDFFKIRKEKWWTK